MTEPEKTGLLCRNCWIRPAPPRHLLCSPCFFQPEKHRVNAAYRHLIEGTS